MTPTVIELIGSPEENFFSLGKKDKDSYPIIYDQISKLCARNNMLAKILKLSTEYSGKWLKKSPQHNIREIEAYAAGLERPVDDVLFSLLLPELVASFNKWTPQLINLIPGCSSLFMQDKATGGVLHARVLDYALAGPFEKFEKIIKYDFNHRHSVLSFNTSGMPFPSLSAVNDKGLSLALHYKHGDFFDLEGESIFLICQEILYQCSTIHEAVKMLKAKKSIAYWGIYLSDANGEVVSIDINGPDFYQQKYDIADHPFLYFNNRPILHKSHHMHLQPYGNAQQCIMRQKSIEQMMQDQQPTNLEELVNTLGSLPKNNKKEWRLAPMTPSSIQLVGFDAKNKQAIKVAHQAPKFAINGHYKINDIFNRPEVAKLTHKKKPTKLQQAYQRFALFQSAIDLGNISEAYHQIQMSIILADKHSEKYLAQFFFHVLEYIYEHDKRDLSYLLEDFESLAHKLPPYLEDHRRLFVMRISRFLGLEHSIESQGIAHPELKKLFKRESELNTVALRGMKNLIFPRLEILDIIYAY